MVFIGNERGLAPSREPFGAAQGGGLRAKSVPEPTLAVLLVVAMSRMRVRRWKKLQAGACPIVSSSVDSFLEAHWRSQWHPKAHCWSSQQWQAGLAAAEGFGDGELSAAVGRDGAADESDGGGDGGTFEDGLQADVALDQAGCAVPVREGVCGSDSGGDSEDR